MSTVPKAFNRMANPAAAIEPRLRPVTPDCGNAVMASVRDGGIWLRFPGAWQPVAFDNLPDAGLLMKAKEWAPRLKTDELAPGELRVFLLYAQGFSNKEIARAFKISHRTVSTQFERIRKKTGLRNEAEVAVYAHRVGLTKWPFEVTGNRFASARARA